MKRAVVVAAIPLGLAAAYLAAHLVLIEAGREVIVLRTREPDGTWLETRLWIVDDAEQSWIHGGDSQWMRNLQSDFRVEVERGGRVAAYNASPEPGPHERIHELLREKYGIADRWVRFVAGDEGSVPVRLVPR